MTTAAQTPPSSVTPDSVIQLATGFMASKHLFVANEIGLFQHLAVGPATLDELPSGRACRVARSVFRPTRWSPWG